MDARIPAMAIPEIMLRVTSLMSVPILDIPLRLVAVRAKAKAHVKEFINSIIHLLLVEGAGVLVDNRELTPGAAVAMPYSLSNHARFVESDFVSATITDMKMVNGGGVLASIRQGVTGLRALFSAQVTISFLHGWS